MATIVTREVGATATGSPLSNAQLDNNFINLNADIATRISSSEKGSNGGVATLDANGKVPATQLPSYVDDVLEYASFASLPETGESGKIYVAIDTSKSYRWGGTVYVEISANPGSTDAVVEGSTNLYFTTARARSAISASGSLSYDSSTGTLSYTETPLTSANIITALNYTPANNASLANYLPLTGGTVTGNILNSAAYSAPSNTNGAGTKVLIQGATGTGANGPTGGNGYIEILGAGSTTPWASFDSLPNGIRQLGYEVRRGGIVLQSGTAQGDAENTFVNGADIGLYGGTGTNNGTKVGAGGHVTIKGGTTTKLDGNISAGAVLTVEGGFSTTGGLFRLSSGNFEFDGANLGLSGGAGVFSTRSTSTQASKIVLSGGGFSASLGLPANGGGRLELLGATSTSAGDVVLMPGTMSGGQAGTNGKAYVYTSEILTASNYSNYAQPLLISGTNIKTINGTSLLGSGDITITAGGGGVTSFNTRTGDVTLSSSDVTTALTYTPANSSSLSNYLPLSGGTLTNSLTITGTDNSLLSQHNIAGNNWSARILSKNATTNVASFLGNYGGRAGVFAHNNALTQWATLHINTLSGSGSGTVYLPAEGTYTLDEYDNAYEVVTGGNYHYYSLPLSGGTLTGRLTVADEFKIGGERRYFIGNLTTDVNAKRYEIARVYIDYNDWHGAGTILVELQNTYFAGGDRQVYSISYDYNIVNCDLIESIGPRGRNAKVTCSAPTQVSGDSYYISVYADLKYYGYYDVYVTTSWPEVTTHGAHLGGAILIYKAPSGSPIADFNVNDDVVMRASSLTLSGNAVLHTGNYTSYNGHLRALGGNDAMDFNTLTYNSMYYAHIASSANKPTSYSYPYGVVLTFDPGVGTAGRAQFYVSHNGNDLCFRGGWNGNDSWTTWNKALTDQNYNSYSPSLTGSGASGTWGINITGSAASASTANNVTGTVAVANGGTGVTTRKAASTMVANFGQLENHGTYTDANEVKQWGGTFIQGSTNTPNFNGTTQHYQMMLSLGGNYEWGTDNVYAAQIAFARNVSNPYLGIRYKEGGTDTANWGSWTKFSAGYADTAGSVSGGLTTSNYSSYALPLNGGTLTGTVYLNSDVIVGNNGGSYAYTAAANGKLYFGSAGADAPSNYHIGTVMEDYGGNYSKLDFRWYTGQRFYADYAYGGFRFKQITTGNTLFSVGEADLNVRVANILYINSNVALHAGNYNSYSPTLTGGNASGTWGINITGNAATATTAANGGVTSVNGMTGAVTVSGGSGGGVSFGKALVFAR